MKKYVVYGMPFESKNDGDKFYLSAFKIAKLYNVNLNECILIDYNDESKLVGIDTSKYIALYPRYDGNYTLK